MSHTLPFVLMRGGTSKGVFLREQDVPKLRAELTAVLLDLFGSPDRRQIDGLGGADKLTSKAAIIGPPVRTDSDVSYLFGQVGTVRAEVDYNLNCGNLLAAVGLYAIEEQLIPVREGITTVRVHNVNTDKIIHVSVPVRDGVAQWRGDLSIGGVPGTGASIALDFSRAVGAITGQMLPTGKVCEFLEVPDVGSIEVSIVDGANLAVYVQASALGMTGKESPDAIDVNDELKRRMDAIRRCVAYRCGLRDYWDARKAPSTPMLIAIGEPVDYVTCTQGERIAAAEVDMLVRQYASGSASKTLAATLTATTGLACRIEGSLPQRLIASNCKSGSSKLSFGHPSGVIHVESAVVEGVVMRLSVLRTARRIAEGRAYLKHAF